MYNSRRYHIYSLYSSKNFIVTLKDIYLESEFLHLLFADLVDVLRCPSADRLHSLKISLSVMTSRVLRPSNASHRLVALPRLSVALVHQLDGRPLIGVGERRGSGYEPDVRPEIVIVTAFGRRHGAHPNVVGLVRGRRWVVG